jgi:hypothetical protein
VSQKKKGNLLEDLVVRLFQDDSLDIQVRKRLKSKLNPSHMREIDVLIQGTVAGYTRFVAIECKNLDMPVSVGKIDEFAGKLMDVGIPVQNGVYVSNERGFSRDAIDRAESLGIRPLVFNGLNSEHLSEQLHEALQTELILTLTLDTVHMSFDQDVTYGKDLMLFYDRSGTYQGHLADLIFAYWRDGKISGELGKHVWSEALPDGWYSLTSSGPLNPIVTADVIVTGYLVDTFGSSTRSSLHHPRTNELERANISTKFPSSPPGTSVPVRRINTEEQLIEIRQDQPAALVSIDLGRRKAPRVRFENLYWPWSERVSHTIPQLIHHRIKSGTWSGDFFESVPKKEIEGTDLGVLWEPIDPRHPAANDPSWPFTKPRKTKVNPRKKHRR